MPIRTPGLLCLLLSLYVTTSLAQTIELTHQDAVVWSQDQVVRGTLVGATEGFVYLGDEPIAFSAEDGSFEVAVRLVEHENVIVACADDVCSEEVRWTLGFEPRPEVELGVTVEGRTVTLAGHVLDNPLGTDLSFEWVQDPENPAPVSLSTATDTLATTVIDEGAPHGEYYFDLIATATDGGHRRARTFVTVDDEGVRAFDIGRDYAAWIDDAVIYSIAPWYFARYCQDKFACIEERIPEIASLGVSALWLQPVYPNYGKGQAYDVTDYFGIWDELGDEGSLRSLIQTAKSHGLRVMFDFVPNHSSIHHPYAQDAIAHGERSHYWDFYMREFSDAPYSNNYKHLTIGEMTFVYYFWTDLVTFNLHSEETQRYLIEAARYWIEEFDIDGYRIDAVWAPHARNPEYMHEWRNSLKRVKPEVFLLAEDKAADSDAFPAGFPSTFENFDVAYDWTSSAWCISHWAWAYPGDCNYYPVAYGNTAPKYTIFNRGNDGVKAANLRRSVTNQGDGFHPDARILRFIENNDTPRFIANHNLDQTKMAAALAFSLHGVPMLYYAQESGVASTWPIIGINRTIRSYDSHGVWPYYQHLVGLRNTYASLRSDNFAEVDVVREVPLGRVFAFHRWLDDENIFAVLNLGAGAVSTTLALPVDNLALDPEKPYFLTDLLTGDYIEAGASELVSLDLELPPHSAALYALADTVIHISVSTEGPPVELPQRLVLHQNYPNPFRSSATIAFDLPVPAPTRLEVFDLIGRRVATLVSADLGPGRHEVTIGANDLPSGVYLYRLESGGRVETRTLTIVR